MRIGIAHVLLHVVVVAACGRTLPGQSSGTAERSSADAGPQCTENGDCAEDELCLDQSCVYFGECLRDFHCGTLGGCVDNQCVGEWPEFEPGEPMACQINADCPRRHYCVESKCALGVECLLHAHCDVGSACVGRLCVNAR